MDETTGSTHDLLLALAGRLDDDMLAWARELVAVGEDTRAIELVAAGLAADAVALPAPLRAEFVDAARAARIDLDADAALPAASAVGPLHRFAAAPDACDDHVARALRALPARLLDGAEVQLTWRLTPTGGAPGPLPHPVVLVEVEPGGRPADVLAYQLSVGLDRAGVVASVEVLTGGRPLSDYHAAARREARRIDGSATAPPVVQPAAVQPAVVQPAVAQPAVAELILAEPEFGEPVAVAGAARPELADTDRGSLWVDDEAPVAPSEPDATATDPTGAVVGDEPAPTPRAVPFRSVRDDGPTRNGNPDPRPAPRPLERRRTTVTPLSRAFLPSPVPLTRRDGNRSRPLAPVTDEQDTASEAAAYSSPEQGQIPALADTPTFRSMQDPLSGPLNAPLLAPLLDPTPYGGVDEADAGGAYDDPFGPSGISPLAPDRPGPARTPKPSPGPAPAPVENRWTSEWASGDWAVSASDLGSDAERGLGVPDEPVDEPGPEVEEAPRHRFPAGPPPAPQLPSPPDGPPAPVSASPPAPSPPAPSPPAPSPPAPSPRPPLPRPEPTEVSPPRPGPGGTAARPPAAEQPEPVGEAPAGDGLAGEGLAGEGLAGEGLGLRPDSVARLSDADRELLARLQSELGAGPRPRASRRAGVAQPHSNGNGRVDPP